MENKVKGFKITKREIIHTFNDFNEDYENVEFTAVMTTDHYRPGRPYKLFNFRGESQVQFTFDLPENIKKPTCLHLTTTECCWSGMIDIFVNDNLCSEKLESAGANWQTREIKLEVDRGQLKPKNNKITMKLRDDAEFVYWLYAAVIEVTYIVPFTLAGIAARAVATMIKDGQISEEAVNDEKRLPKVVTRSVYEWM